jgi:HRAS-like suppressor 3
VRLRAKEGDHLASPRLGYTYTHHGICIGNERVVHYAGLARGLTAGPVEEVTLDEFANGNSFQVIEHPTRKYRARASAMRAKGRIGEDTYCLITNNCEHFVHWCIEGENRSAQTDFRLEHLPGGLVVAVIGIVPYSLLRRLFG